MKKIISIVFLGLLMFSFTKKEDSYTEINQDSKFTESIKRGKEVYTDMCISCHMANGEGLPKVYPPLAKSDYLMEKREASISAIKYGLKGKIVVNGITYKNMMSRLGLLDDEVADVMNYITNSWGNKNSKMITIEEVKAVSKK
ncbi:c-type cytochrome [Polaribacter vadi]|nr:cytochrome c [Polaribacter vadi]